jgi:hypothetical protein
MFFQDWICLCTRVIVKKLGIFVHVVSPICLRYHAMLCYFSSMFVLMDCYFVFNINLAISWINTACWFVYLFPIVSVFSFSCSSSFSSSFSHPDPPPPRVLLHPIRAPLPSPQGICKHCHCNAQIHPTQLFLPVFNLQVLLTDEVFRQWLMSDSTQVFFFYYYSISAPSLSRAFVSVHSLVVVPTLLFLC